MNWWKYIMSRFLNIILCPSAREITIIEGHRKWKIKNIFQVRSFRKRLHEEPEIASLTWKVIPPSLGDRQPHSQNVKNRTHCQTRLGMKLSWLVVVTALIQASLDTAGIIISLLCPLATGTIAFDELQNDKWEFDLCNIHHTFYDKQTCCVWRQFLGDGRGADIPWLFQNTELSPCDLYVTSYLEWSYSQDDGRLQVRGGGPDGVWSPGLLAQPPQVRRQTRLN